VAGWILFAKPLFDRRTLRLAPLVGGDALFAALFFDYLRRTARSS
jgi:hypothetical protein